MPPRVFDSALRAFASRTARQSAFLIATQGLAMVLSFAFTMLITRGLGVEAYGLFRYAMTFLALAMTLLQFGWPNSAARLLALESDPSSHKQITGACLILLLGSSLFGTVMTFAAWAAAAAAGYRLPRVLLWVAPFLYVTLGQYMMGSICQGLNRISLLSVQQVLPYVLLLPITAVQLFVLKRYSLAAAVIGYVAVFSLVVAVGFARVGVAFTNWAVRVRAVLAENRQTGFPIYFGSIFGVASGHVVAIWVAQYMSLSRYGQYALALAVSGPLAVLVSSVGTVLFRSSSRRDSLPHSVLVASLGLVGVMGVSYLVAVDVLLVRAFGAQYGPSVPMAQWMGLSSLMIGLGDIFNRFLGAHGRGRALCLAAVATGIVALTSAAVLLPRWDAYGAVASSLLSGATYVACMSGLYLYYTGWRPQPRATA